MSLVGVLSKEFSDKKKIHSSYYLALHRDQSPKCFLAHDVKLSKIVLFYKLKNNTIPRFAQNSFTE